jgi:hypothetical protein
VSSKTAILDTTGAVKRWIDERRGVKVWVSQLIGESKPDVFTPGDVETEPHWAYKGGWRLLEESEIVFYSKGHIYYDVKRRKYYEWSSAPSGWRAARKAVESCPRDNGNAPLKLQFEYTVEEILYETAETNAAGRPLGMYYRVVVVQWSAPREEGS